MSNTFFQGAKKILGGNLSPWLRAWIW